MIRSGFVRKVCPIARVAAGLLTLVLAACAGGDKPKPTPLDSVTPQIAGRQVWRASMDGVKFPLSIAVTGESFTVADSDGQVMALDAQTGASLWRGDAGSDITAGVGSDGRIAAVVTRGNELVVFDAGRLLWRKRLGSRVTTSPLVAGERVFVIGVDRVVNAYDALDGRWLWTYRKPGEPLTLLQQGVLGVYKDSLLVGQGARLVSLDPLRGTVNWDVPVASPRGANEVERLADLVGPLRRNDKVVCVRSFQSAVGCVDAERGALLWSKNIGGLDGVGADARLVVGADASSRISAWRADSGELAWSSENLLHRGLSAPLVVGRVVVFGDVEGQVHFLSRLDGRTWLRLPTDGSAVAAAPALSGITILVATRDGGLYAFRPE